MARVVKTWVLVAAACFVVGCGGSSGAPAPAAAPGTVTGSLLVTDGTAGPIIESEPNDTVDQSHDLGTIKAGQTIEVFGHTDSAPGVDPFDGFRLRANSRMKITATMSHDPANDFDMFVFDLVSLQEVENFEDTASPEVGVFHFQGDIDIVVQSFTGDGDYTLTITAEAAAATIAEREPNDFFGQAQFLGTLRVGETITVSGNADSATDSFDGFLIACPETADVMARVTFVGGNNFDLIYFDATFDVSDPDLIVEFATTDPNEEVGSLGVTPPTLLELDVRAAAGSSDYVLTIEALAPGSAMAARADPRVAPAVRSGLSAKGGRAASAYSVPRGTFRIGEALVHPAPGAFERLGEELAAAGCEMRAAIPGGTCCVTFDVPAGLTVEEQARWTLARAYCLSACDGASGAQPSFTGRAFAEPNDPGYPLQWHYPLMNLRRAWDLTQGSAAVRVGVIDTGQRSHPDLDGRLDAGYDFVSNANLSGDGDGVDADPTDPGDLTGPFPGTSSWHGTHVAGTIGASTDNGSGVAGVDWNCRVMHLRVIGRPDAFGSTLTFFDVANAILYAARLPNSSGTVPAQIIDVVNLSLGGPVFDATLQDAIQRARNEGVVVVAAAGNSAQNGNPVNHPAASDGVLAVGAVALDRTRAPYSSFGPYVDVCAPGGNAGVDLNGDGFGDGVLSTLFDESSGAPVPSFQFYQGTSMACPHVVGVVALMLAVEPTLTPAQVETILMNTAGDLGAAGRDDEFGFGLVDAFAAVSAAQGGAGAIPVLSLSTRTAGFDTQQTTQTIGIANAGGGLLDVGPATVFTTSGGAWLTATLVGPGDAARTHTSLRLDVDRTGLADGAYSGRVMVASNGGTVQVQVSLMVGAPATGPDLEIFVLAIDPATDNVVRQVVINPSTDAVYTVPNLPPGNYFFVAGTDLNKDGFICDAGELCGMYPSTSAPLAVRVGEGELLAGLNFPVGRVEAVAASAGGARVYPISTAQSGSDSRKTRP